MKKNLNKSFILTIFAIIWGLTFEGRLGAQAYLNVFDFSGAGLFDGAIGTNSDGVNPQSELIISEDILYGTVSYGGDFGGGTVFKVNKNGSGFTVLHDFTAPVARLPFVNPPVLMPIANSDGGLPMAGLVLSSNVLYGTTEMGGAAMYGTVFKIDLADTNFTVLHHFGGGSDGKSSMGGLVLSGNTLYGNTATGGTNNSGTVFKVNTDGTGYMVLHSFTGIIGGDGYYPRGNLVISSNLLFGITGGGGTNLGTIYAIKTDGTGFTTLHNFASGAVSAPNAGLVLSGNILYGTTSVGYGTVFALNTDGSNFRLLHSFSSVSDGSTLYAGLSLAGTNLYGVANGGGRYGHGTVFTLNTDGTEFKNLYNFKGGDDGNNPYGGVVVADQTLYGTTTKGGVFNLGIIFSVALEPGFFIVPTFDESITSDPNGAAMMDAINAAAWVFHTNLTDNARVYINFVNRNDLPSGSLALSSTWRLNVAYADYLNNLKSNAVSFIDSVALATLPNSVTNPVTGTTNINLSIPMARYFGMFPSVGDDFFDATINVDMNWMNFTRPAGDANKYDLQETIEHEIDEVLGTASGLPNAGKAWADTIFPMDLFRYTDSLTRTYTTNGDNAYFSIDGKTLLARYNMRIGNDYGDWMSAGNIYWAPPGLTPGPQVQDSNGKPGVFGDLGPNELAMLDVIGWTLNVTPPALLIAPFGSGQLAVSWTNNASGYVLQETTDLLSSAGWTNSAAGPGNSVVVAITGQQKFFRLNKVSTPAPALALSKTATLPVVNQITPPPPASSRVLKAETRSYQAR